MGVKVTVTDRCSGHGQCYSLCPEVFAPDEEGYAVVKEADATAFLDGARKAAAACPERAIHVEVN